MSAASVGSPIAYRVRCSSSGRFIFAFDARNSVWKKWFRVLINSVSIGCCVSVFRIFPIGWYPSPSTSYIWNPSNICFTVISFFVSVPVLSVQMTFTHQSVSTDANCFTSALFLASLHAANDSAILTCAGNPCGIIEAEIPIANMNASLGVKCASREIIIKITQRINVPIVSFFAIFFISFWSGVSSGICSCDKFAILPSSVFIPVANTTHHAYHVATVVHIHTQLFLSEINTSPLISCVNFFWGLDSPVSEKSFVWNSDSWMILTSAGILSHSSIYTISHGTNFSASSSTITPFLLTLAFGWSIFLSDSIILSALAYWIYPIIALTNIMNVKIVAHLKSFK